MTVGPDIRLDSGGALVLVVGILIAMGGAISELPIIVLWGCIPIGLIAVGYPLALRRAQLLERDAFDLSHGTPAGPGGGV
ncbi:MAG: hypothetical protein ACI9OJ_001788, partial [Myxococcota bacterium]